MEDYSMHDSDEDRYHHEKSAHKEDDEDRYHHEMSEHKEDDEDRYHHEMSEHKEEERMDHGKDKKRMDHEQMEHDEHEGEKFEDEKHDEMMKEEEELPVDAERDEHSTISEVGPQAFIAGLAYAPIDTEWNWDTEAQDEILGSKVGRYGQEDELERNWGLYAQAHLYIEDGNLLTKGVYKLPFQKIIDGRLHVVFKALVSAVGALNGARGGVAIPEVDREVVYSVIKEYYN